MHFRALTFRPTVFDFVVFVAIILRARELFLSLGAILGLERGVSELERLRAVL